MEPARALLPPACGAALIIGALSCSGAPRCPAQSTPWLAARTAHFELHSNLDEPRVRRVALELEEAHAAQWAALWPDQTPGRERALAVALRSAREVTEFAAGKLEGFAGTDALGQPFLVANPDDGLDAQQAAQHELAHLVIGAHAGALPRWLSEGLAMWLQSARLEGGTAVIGERPHAPLFTGAPAGIPGSDLHRTLIWDLGGKLDRAGRVAAHYRNAWAIVALLSAERPEVLRALIADGNPRDPEAAFAARVPDAHDLAPRIAKLAAWGQPPPRRVPASRPSGPIAVRELRHAEVHGLFARLYAHGSDPAGRARAVEEGREALRLEPDEPLGVLYGDPARPPDRLRALTRSRPDDWRAWKLLERGLVEEADEAERAAARSRAAALRLGD